MTPLQCGTASSCVLDARLNGPGASPTEQCNAGEMNVRTIFVRLAFLNLLPTCILSFSLVLACLPYTSIIFNIA